MEGSDGKASAEEAQAVEAFANAAVAKLPKILQKTPMAMDVALLVNGHFEIIETNPKGNGGFIAFKPGSVEVMNEYLSNYPQIAKGDAQASGLTEAQQMRIVESLFEKYNIDPKVQFAGFQFDKNGFTDSRYKLTATPEYNSGFKNFESKARNSQEAGSFVQQLRAQPVVRTCKELLAL